MHLVSFLSQEIRSPIMTALSQLFSGNLHHIPSAIVLFNAAARPALILRTPWKDLAFNFHV